VVGALDRGGSDDGEEISAHPPMERRGRQIAQQSESRAGAGLGFGQVAARESELCAQSEIRGPSTGLGCAAVVLGDSLQEMLDQVSRVGEQGDAAGEVVGYIRDGSRRYLAPIREDPSTGAVDVGGTRISVKDRK
jgi:hypothetical protein